MPLSFFLFPIFKVLCPTLYFPSLLSSVSVYFSQDLLPCAPGQNVYDCGKIYLEVKVITNANLLLWLGNLNTAAQLRIKIWKRISKINTQPGGYFF